MSDTPGLREDEISRAVTALLKHIDKQQAKANELLENDELLYLVRRRPAQKLVVCISDQVPGALSVS